MKNELNKKPTVSVGIPAYNEASNIKRLVTGLLEQSHNKYVLEKIIVASDGSNDDTEKEVLSIKNDKVVLIKDGLRKGKPVRMNDMFVQAQSDIFVQFDADVLLSNNEVLDKLVEPVIKYGADMVCANHLPKKPINLIQEINFFGVRNWNKIIDEVDNKTLLYRCIGRARAFSKKFYTSFRFPGDIGSLEDTYSFYWSMKNDFKVYYQPNAVVYYMLPLTLKDYEKQMGRFMNSWVVIERYFNSNFINRYNIIDTKLKLKSLIKTIKINNIHIMFLYILLQAYMRLASHSYVHKATWDVSSSTKDLKLKGHL